MPRRVLTEYTSLIIISGVINYALVRAMRIVSRQAVQTNESRIRLAEASSAMAAAAVSGILPTGGMTSAASPAAGWLSWLRDVAWHVPVPAFALGLPLAATLERVQSQALADSLAEPCMAAALARSEILKHAATSGPRRCPWGSTRRT